MPPLLLATSSWHLLASRRALFEACRRKRPSVRRSVDEGYVCIENDTVFTGYEFGRPCEDKYNNILIPEEYILY